MKLKIFLLLILSLTISSAQRKWKRSEPKPEQELQLLHSTHVINFPTTTTLKKGEWEFEISHRFYPTVNSGDNNFWGLDGPVFMRIALAYAFDDKSIIAIGRSNYRDNYDLSIKRQFYEFENVVLPFQIAARVGTAWNTQLNDLDVNDTRNFQYYGQIIINSYYNKFIGIGIVPSYLFNSHPGNINKQSSFTLGSYLQFYFLKFWSVILEWNPTLSGYREGYNTFSAGVEIETGGHFFKIIATNNAYLNTSQVLPGADKSILDGDWRLGFNITRLLTF